MKIKILTFYLLLFSCLCFSQDVPKLYKEAMDEYHNGNYIESHKLFEKFIKGYTIPDELYATAKYYSSDALLKLGETDAAVDGFEFFVNNYKLSAYRSKALYNLGLIYYDKGEFAESRKNFQILLTDYPNSEYSGSALNWIGQSYLAENKPEEAIKFLGNAVESKTNNGFMDQSLFVLASTSQKMGDYKNAVKYYDQLISYYVNSPLVPKAHVRIAECDFRLGDYQSAIVELGNPDLSSLPSDLYEERLFILANSYYRLKTYDKSEENFKNIILNYPNTELDRPSEYGLAWVYFQTNRYNLAFNMFNSLTNNDDSISVKSYYWRAEVKKYAGEDSDAVKLFNVFLQKYPDNQLASNAKYQIGVLSYNQNNLIESEKFLNESMNSSSDAMKIKALTLKGEINLNQKDYQSAKESFLSAIAITDVPAELQNRAALGLGIALYYLGDYDDAISYLQGIAKNNPNFEKDKVNFYIAESYYGKQNYSEALKEYNLVDVNNPQVGGLALYGKAYCNFSTQHYAESAAQFKDFVNKFPNDQRALDARMRLADSYYGSKNFAAASRVYKDIFNIDKNSLNNPYAYYQYAQALFKAGSSNEAILEFSNLQQKFPDSEYADKSLYVVGWIYFKEGNYRTAIKSYRHVLSVYPNSTLGPLIFYSIGDSYFNMSKYDSAITSYKKVLSDYPNSNNVYDAVNGLQYAYVAKGQPQKAIDFIDEYVSKNPNSSFADEIFYKKGEIYYSEMKYAEAENSYKQYITNYPNGSSISDAYYWIGKCEENLKQNNEALVSFKKVFDSYPQSESASAAVLEIGNIYNNLNQYDSALAVYNAAIQTIKNSDRMAEILFMKGSTLANKKDPEDAYSVFSQVMQNYPNTIFSEKSKLELGLIEMAAKRYDNAESYFQDLASNRTDELGAQGQYYYGMTMMEQDSLDDAIDAFIKVRNFFPGYDQWVTNAYLQLGECYTKKNEIQKAKNVYRDVLAKHRGDEYGKEAEKKLRELE
jgi:TolA-binding protein